MQDCIFFLFGVVRSALLYDSYFQLGKWSAFVGPDLLFIAYVDAEVV